MAPPEELVSFDVAGLRARRWKYAESGLTVCHVKTSGPIVHGFLGIATEAHDDDGLPHTLEHLIFLGSEDYPFKGVLDTLANRCFARGTNAWTATDHTCYTASHAGSAGFLTLLPVYLDHILYPTITPEGYITEVHHITADGDDAGVVYCEMQARENTSYSLSEYTLQQLMHPNDGYKSETGGRMSSLRDSCSHAKVQAYHQAFYRPDGVVLIVVGDVEPSELFAALEPTMAKIASKGALPPKQRAWATPAPALASPAHAEVLFPSEDESTGIVRLAWTSLPYEPQHFLALSALEILGGYLTDTSVAELQREFVECDDALAGAVYMGLEYWNPAQVSLTFDSVPTAKLDEVKPKLLRVLRDLASGAVDVDMEHMATVLNRRRLEVLSQVEDAPADLFANFCIPNFLYDPSGAAMPAHFDELGRLQTLSGEPASYWRELIQTSLLTPPCASVTGRPSAAFATQSEAAEKKRVDDRKTALGETKLQELGATLEAANAANDQPYEDSLLTAFDMPSVDKLSFHPIATLRSAAAARADTLPPPPPELQAVAAEVTALPLAVQVDHIDSAFVTVKVTARTDGLTGRQRMLLPLLLSVLLESPIVRAGATVPWESVVQQLAAITLSTGSGLGFGGGQFSCGSFAQLAQVEISAEAAKYAEAVKLLAECIYCSVFTVERLKAKVNKKLNAVAKHKRSGGAIVAALQNENLYGAESNYVANSVVNQARFLTALLTQLDAEPAKVCAELDCLRTVLFGRGDDSSVDRLCVQLAGDTTKLAQPTLTAPWHGSPDAFLSLRAAASPSSSSPLPPPPPPPPSLDGPPPPPPPSVAALDPTVRVQPSHTLRTNTANKAVICGVAAVESGFLLQSTPCVSDFSHPDLAAIMVFIEYLTCLEGPFWKQIRGLGLSYSYSINVDAEQGKLTFMLFKSTNVAGAYAKAKAIIEDYGTGATSLEQMMLDTAISTAVYAVVSREETPSSTAGQSFVSLFRGVAPGFNRRLIQQLRAVTPADCMRAITTHFLPLFDPAASMCAVCLNPAKVEETMSKFAAMGHPLENIEKLDDAFAQCNLALKGDDGAGCECMRCITGPIKLGAKRKQ